QCRVVRYVFLERLKGWHLNLIGRGRIVGPVAAVPKIRADIAEKLVGPLDSLKLCSVRFCFRCVAVNLGGIEHGVSASEQQTRARYRYGFITILRFGRSVREFPENDRGSLLTLANLRATVLPLFVRSPLARLVTLRFGGSPKA